MATKKKNDGIEHLPQHIHEILYNNDIPIIIKYFTFQYNRFPNYIIIKIETYSAKLLDYLKKEYADTIKLVVKFKEYSFKRKDKLLSTESNYLYRLKEGLYIDTDIKDIEIVYDDSISNRELIKLKKIIELCRKPIIIEQKKFYMVKRNMAGFDINDFDIRKTNLNIEENYNDELNALNDQLVSFINTEDSNGIVLLHGQPGSGKTTYIRHLITVCNARFIFLPNDLFCQLSEPSFFTFLLEYPNSVIILEDCEELLKPREQNSSTVGIATLLNLSDGLLGDAMRLKIICTFNAKINNIDKALLRKGRLAYKYEFKSLTVEKTNNLLKKLNINLQVKEGLPLSEIYNYAHDNGGNLNKDAIKIGF